MKKFIIIAGALVFTTGILASQTKVNAAKPTTITIPNAVSSDRKDLASAD
jgi:hypothetical protein